MAIRSSRLPGAFVDIETVIPGRSYESLMNLASSRKAFSGATPFHGPSIALDASWRWTAESLESGRADEPERQVSNPVNTEAAWSAIIAPWNLIAPVNEVRSPRLPDALRSWSNPASGYTNDSVRRSASLGPGSLRHGILCLFPSWAVEADATRHDPNAGSVRACYDTEADGITRVVSTDESNRVSGIAMAYVDGSPPAESVQPYAWKWHPFDILPTYYPAFEYSDLRPPWRDPRWLELSFEYTGDEELPTAIRTSVDGVLHGPTLWFDGGRRVVSAAHYYAGDRHGLTVRMDARGAVSEWEWYLHGRRVAYGRAD